MTENKEQTDIQLMRLAIKQAEQAAAEGEVPVGALIVQKGEVISLGRNRRELGRNALYHAEIKAIDRACKKLGGWRLPHCELFVTLEPCPMCAGAIINSRIERVVFGAFDQKAGSFGTLVNLAELPYNHRPQIVGGFLEGECAGLLTDFFKALRKNKE